MQIIQFDNFFSLSQLYFTTNMLQKMQGILKNFKQNLEILLFNLENF